MKRLVSALLLALGGCATTGGYLYFPDLADRILVGDEHAFREALTLARDTSPGEQLEELAELSSRFVQISPEGFLRAQSASPTCFGVSFMGPKYVDNPQAEDTERKLRIDALESVKTPELSATKERCLKELAGT
jgi:hypothetical protein